MSPQTVGGFSVGLHVYVENVDAVVQKAVENGAKPLRPIKNQFYGDRSGSLLDPFGHMWSVATHVEDVSPEEMRKRMTAAMSQAAGLVAPKQKRNSVAAAAMAGYCSACGLTSQAHRFVAVILAKNCSAEPGASERQFNT